LYLGTNVAAMVIDVFCLHQTQRCLCILRSVEPQFPVISFHDISITPVFDESPIQPSICHLRVSCGFVLVVFVPAVAAWNIPGRVRH